MDKPKIDYPCEWSYKVIGTDPDTIQSFITDHFKGVHYSLEESKKSSKGKYTSLQFSLIVENEQERNQIFQFINNIPTVKFVL
ncbi:MAG: DUF493 domain-containing protein [Candidatus Delongbacteria bacterium]|nr:DUF493 domain-containing protein [Candidatus Delongbacteria bacterium]MBN2835792.1 DUF493 domain-containing protein [Candidatus Delongbacteria bacterium]